MGRDEMGCMTNGLTFNTLRGGNTARLPQFKNSKGETAYREKDGSDWSPAQWLQAVVGELGEYANFRKKYERGDLSKEEFQKEAEKELADVVIYLDLLAIQLGINLGQAIIDKFNAVSRRVGSTVRIDAEDWHYTDSHYDEPAL
jgi:NTP pyrophosphatase (non-canonical NTP hydrolase)